MSSVTMDGSHHLHNDADRKKRLKAHLDDFISSEKELLSGRDGDVELQYRLDHFMHRLHERVEAFAKEQQQNLADDLHRAPEALSGELLVEELLPASEVLYLEESIGEEKAAEVIRSIEEEFGVYRIRELNVKEHADQSSKSYILRQGLIGVALAALLLWITWPAAEVLPVMQNSTVSPVVEREVVKVAVTETLVAETAVAEKIVSPDPAVVSPTAEGGETLTVMNYVGNVRSKPSAKGDVLFTVNKGDVVTKLDTKWGWHQIRLHDGREGWAYEGLFVEPKPVVSEE
ncbi:SH3 domain-containing protein [Mariprofundus sp. KV]|uniref:SH3 domain-containing protein n=1 Tax=Mariprofundus sp. KV TaxID=2608715 RepID=UPI0015A2312F|nr:SH3 domain-containing protein [Mariprofundus sp. KV]